MKIELCVRTVFGLARSACVVLLLVALTCPGIAVFAQTEQTPAPQEQTVIKPEQLDALVAPIALYPDNLLAQVLVASTYPIELIQLHQWLQKNPDLQKDQKKLTEKAEKQPWDPSVQAMAPFPDTVKWLAEDIQWTTDLGNVFLAQQKDVMDAVQRMRAKAQQKGTLKSGEQMSVQTQNVDNTEVIVIQETDPNVVYVPSYDPVVVYGDPYPGYPYPPIYYPPYYGAVAGAIGFGIGLIVGAAWGGGWGWGCGWGGGDININRNNNFNRNTNFNGGNRNQINGGNGKWSHNPSHRGGAPYGDRSTANKFGGTSRGDSLGNRQNQANRDLGNRNSGVGDRNGVGGRNDGVGNGNRGGSDRVGNRDIGSGDRNGGLGGGSGGFDRGSTRSSSDRGRSSMGSSRGGFGGGGGMSRGGGFGGGRGGGGRRR